MQETGLAAIYPGPNLSKRNLAHPLYPYLLRNVTAVHPNYVWLHAGWMYLVAVLDWFSRYVVR